MTVSAPAHLERHDHYQRTPRSHCYQAADLVRVTGKEGRYVFLRHVRNTRTGAEWVELRHASRKDLHFTRPDSVKAA